MFLGKVNQQIGSLHDHAPPRMLGGQFAEVSEERRIIEGLGERTIVMDRLGCQLDHRTRLNEISEILEDGARTPYEVASRMTWDLVAESWTDFPVVQKWFAVSEAVSHLRYLERRGVIAGSKEEGVMRFRSA